MSVFDTLNARDLRIKVGAHHNPTDPVAEALGGEPEERALRLVDTDGEPTGAVIGLDPDCGLWGLADRDAGMVEGSVDRNLVRTALGHAKTVHVVRREETDLTGEVRHPEIRTDGGTITCEDCGDQFAEDDAKALMRPGEDAEATIICPDCQVNHPYDRQYAPADPAALLSEDGENR